MAEDVMAAMAAMMASVLAECPDLEKVGVVGVVDVVVRDASGNMLSLEKAIIDTGGIGPEVASSFMTMAAMAAIIDSFPDEDDRKRLAKAGRVIGQVIVKRWRERVKMELVAKLRAN